MKTNMKQLLSSAFALILGIGASAAADKPPVDPLRDVLFPPQLILHFGKKIGLSDHQRDFIVSEIRAAEELPQDHKGLLESAKAKLVRIMKKTIIGEEEATEALRGLLMHENELKVMQYRMFARLKNHLTAEQRGQLRKLKRNFDPKKAGPSKELRKRLQLKMEKLKQGMQELAGLGVSPEPIQKMIEDFHRLFAAWSFAKAEAVLDKAIKKLDDPF